MCIYDKKEILNTLKCLVKAQSEAFYIENLFQLMPVKEFSKMVSRWIYRECKNLGWRKVRSIEYKGSRWIKETNLLRERK